MKLTDLYEMQGGLMANIDYKGEDKAEKMFTATFVELGEFAQEWRGFKYWSKDQKPRRRSVKPCLFCEGVGEKEEIDLDSRVSYEYCEKCDGTGEGLVYDPLLEEYVDVLHFFLEWGIMLRITPPFIEPMQYDGVVDSRVIAGGINDLFISLAAIRMQMLKEDYNDARRHYLTMMQTFLLIGHMVGLTSEQIHTAYMEKNKVNHTRQNTGY